MASNRRPATTVAPKTLRFLTLNLWGENGPWDAAWRWRRAIVGAGPDVIGAAGGARGAGPRAEPGGDAGGRARRIPCLRARRRPGGAATKGWRSCRGSRSAPTRPARCRTRRRMRGASCFRRASTAMLAGSGSTRRISVTARDEGNKREEQVMAIDEVVTAHANDNPQVVIGDFNATPDSDEIRWLCGRTTLAGRRVAYQDAWARAEPGRSRGSPGPRPTPTRRRCAGWSSIAASTTSS